MRKQVLLPEWQIKYLKKIAEANDCSFSCAIRLCVAVIVCLYGKRPLKIGKKKEEKDDFFFRARNKLGI